MINSGWECPVCKRVLAPWMPHCDNEHKEPTEQQADWDYEPNSSPSKDVHMKHQTLTGKGMYL